jgi:phosphate/sulfate permease
VKCDGDSDAELIELSDYEFMLQVRNVTCSLLYSLCSLANPSLQGISSLSGLVSLDFQVLSFQTEKGSQILFYLNLEIGLGSFVFWRKIMKECFHNYLSRIIRLPFAERVHVILREMCEYC